MIPKKWNNNCIYFSVDYIEPNIHLQGFVFSLSCLCHYFIYPLFHSSYFVDYIEPSVCVCIYIYIYISREREKW